jgi:hypothetical protein
MAKPFSVLFLALALLAARASPAASVHPDVHDLMPAFWEAWDTSTAMDPSKRLSAFRLLLLRPNLGIYGMPQFSAEMQSDRKLSLYLENLNPLIPTMRRTGFALAKELPGELTAIRSRLPGLRIRGVSFYLLPAFHNAGEVVSENGRLKVLLGVDGIAQLKPQPPVAMDIAHLVFHLYQAESRPEGDFQDGSLWEMTWTEGSAAYASQQLVAGVTEAQALMSDALADTNERATRKLACSIEASEKSESDTVLASFLREGFHRDGLPARGSYLIGYLIAKDLAKRLSLSEMAAISSGEIRSLFDKRLGALCSRGRLSR